MKKFKEFYVDLGGSFPAKSEAVQRHAFDLGYKWVSSGRSTIPHTQSRIEFNQHGNMGIVCPDTNLKGVERITAEQFLELTPEDVIEEEPTAYYKWRLWMPSGDIDEPDYLLSEDGCGGAGYEISYFHDAIKREKISGPVYKCEGQE